MKFGLRAKLLLSYFLLALVVLAASGVVLGLRLREGLMQQLVEELFVFGRQVCRYLDKTGVLDQDASLQLDVGELGALLGVRLSVVAADGKVLADSELSYDSVQRLENHSRRPEILEAKHSGQGHSIRYSTTLGQDMLYAAVSCQKISKWPGTVRIARPLSSVSREVSRAFYQLGLVLAAAFLLAVILALVASQLLASPLKRLLSETKELARRGPGLGEEDREDDFQSIRISFRHITEKLRESMTELGRQRDLMMAVFNGMEEGLLHLDRDSQVTLANPRAVSMLGIQEKSLPRPLVELVRNDELHRVCRRALEGVGGEAEIKLGDRKIFVRVTPIAGSSGAVAVLYDVTELRRLETVRRDFVANVAHELRTPLSVIRANIETLLSGALEKPEPARRFTESALRSVERLSRLVEDLLDLSRLESGSFRPQLGPVSLAQIAAQVIDLLRTAAEKKKISLASEVPENLSVLSWPEGLEQVLYNLVDNAVKYTQEGGQVRLRAKVSSSLVRIEVSDDGPGIEPHHRPRLFERFYRVDKGRSRELGGTGLGLAIVKHLVESMGGKVGVDDNMPRGSVFWVELKRS